MKIRNKLLVTFLSAILIPLIVTVSFFFIYVSYKTSDAEFDRVNINKSSIELSSKISQHYDEIKNFDVFNPYMLNELKPFHSVVEYIEIVDLNGKIIYSSQDKNRIGNSIDPQILAYHSSNILSASYKKKDSDSYLKVISPLAVNNSIKGFIIFKRNPYNLLEYAKSIAYPVVWLGIGSIMLVIIFFSWLISRGIIIPLKELSNATLQISKGNLDFEIKYKANDEFGDLCTAFNIMRDKLKDSLKKQVDYENSRKELVASISHDLRTPLTSIKGYVEGLRDGVVKDPEKFKKYLDVIYTKTESMNKMIDDLFEYSRLDLNILKMNKQKIDSRKMLDDIIINLGYDVESNNISFMNSINFDSFIIDADRLRIEEVINNLVSNALRYARSRIELKADVNDNTLTIYVNDDGCGISDDEKIKVFERFYRSEKSRSARTGGAGLGLAIAKKIIEEHDGKIWVESVVGEGSAFCFTIPGAKNNTIA